MVEHDDRELLDLSGADAEKLRAQIISVLRGMFVDQAAKAAGGKSVDPQRIVQVAEVLLRLLPAPPSTPDPAGSEHSGARERLAALIGGSDTQTDRAAELEALRTENEKLKERLRQQAAAVQPTPAKSGQKAAPSSDVAPVKEKWKPPSHWLKSGQEPEPWRDHFIGPHTNRQYWGPVGS